MTYKVNILNPKAKKILLEMEANNLISISELDEKQFMNLVKSIRKKALKIPISKEEVTREVEILRGKRYARKKGQSNI